LSGGLGAGPPVPPVYATACVASPTFHVSASLFKAAAFAASRHYCAAAVVDKRAKAVLRTVHRPASVISGPLSPIDVPVEYVQ